MIFSNVLFIVYGMSCARGQTYDLEIISGVYNHVRFSKVITQPGYSLELALLHCADEPQKRRNSCPQLHLNFRFGLNHAIVALHFLRSCQPLLFIAFTVYFG